MNFTFDDSELDLSYSTGWETQPSTDPNLSSFFQSTYHAATSDGATVNLTFFGASFCSRTDRCVAGMSSADGHHSASKGSAVFIVGSKGPDHVCLPHALIKLDV